MKPIPTIQELHQFLTNDFRSKLNIQNTRLKKVLDALASVLAGMFKLSYLRISDVENNVFPDTADLEENGGTLERFGRLRLRRNPRPATVAIYKATVTGVIGSTLRINLTFKSNEDAKNQGKLFTLDQEIILTATSQEIEIRSIGVGAEFSLDVGDRLTITEPVIGVNQTIEIASIVEEPKARESIEDYRNLIVDTYQLEPQGGAKTDYMQWSTDAQGVRRVYPYVKNGEADTVQVFVEATIEDSTDGKGTPSITLISEVESVINFDPDSAKPQFARGRRPMQANLEVLPIDLIPVTITIIGLSQQTPAIEQLILNTINNYLYTIRPYIAGGDLPRDKNDLLFNGQIQAKISDVLSDGNFFEDLVLTVNGNTVLKYEFGLGDIPNLTSLIFA